MKNPDEITSIRVRESTKALLAAQGSKGESYEDIINHYEEYVKAYPIKEFKYPPENE